MFDEVMEEEGWKVRKGWESKSKEGKREGEREKEREKKEGERKETDIASISEIRQGIARRSKIFTYSS